MTDILDGICLRSTGTREINRGLDVTEIEGANDSRAGVAGPTGLEEFLGYRELRLVHPWSVTNRSILYDELGVDDVVEARKSHELSATRGLRRQRHAAHGSTQTHKTSDAVVDSFRIITNAVLENQFRLFNDVRIAR